MTNYEELVRLVTEQVTAVLESRGTLTAPAREGYDRLLVIGDHTLLSEEMRREHNICGIDDYKPHQNILRYRKVAITKLTLTELADIAAGRDAGANQCAVIQALLQGVDVYLYEDALPHTRYVGKGSTMFYAMLEGYVRTLRTFGVKPADRKGKETPAEPRPPRFQAPPVEVPTGNARPNSDRLITEDVAKRMVEGQVRVVIPKGAIVTPAAWDVFRQVEVEREV